MEEKKEEGRNRETELRRRAAEALLERGVVFQVERRGFLRVLRPGMRLTIHPPTLGVLYAVSCELAGVELDPKRVEDDPIGYGFSLVRQQAEAMARAVACAVLGTRWKIRWFAGWYGRYLMWQLTTAQLLKLVVTVLSIGGTADFINSIRLIKGTGLLSGRSERMVEPGRGCAA